MGPYIAVIKDSFREAMASRVLWILLIVISFVLVALAPFGFSEKVTTRLRDEDFVNFGDFVERVQASPEAEAKTPALRVWESMDESQQKALKRFKPGENRDGFEMVRVVRQFLRHLNELIEERDFYDPEYFENTRLLTSEGRELLTRVEKEEPLSEMEMARFNRLVFEAAFPDVIRTGTPTSLQFRYWSSDLGPALPITRSDFNQQAKSWVAYIMKWFVGIIGVIVAILVTASIIPQMFDPGSLHLLLSNPVSRSLLFLSKFIGGCAFTLLSAAYLIGGLWLLLGVRFDVWEANLLYSIPLYVFVFAIYYSVSALAGAVWRNPLICIAISVLFWLVCLSMGYVKYGYEAFALEATKFDRLVPAGDTMMAVNKIGVIRAWNKEKGEWDEVLTSEVQKAMQVFVSLMPETSDEFGSLGPVYDSRNDRVINVVRDMQRGGKLVTLVGSKTAKNQWAAKEGAAPPSGMIRLLQEPDGGVLAVSAYGLYRLEGDPFEKPESKSLFGVVPLPNMSSGPYKSVGPSPAVILTRPYGVAMDPVSGALATYSRNEITLLAKQENRKFEVVSSFGVAENTGSVVLAVTGGHLLIGQEDGGLLLYDTATRKLIKRFDPESRGVPVSINASPDGRTFAVVFNNGNLWVVEADAQQVTKPRVRGQGDVCAIQFTGEKTLLVTHQSIRVNECSLDDRSIINSYSPGMGVLERVYRYFVYPLYVVFPKPSELDRTIEYTLASKEDAKKIENPFQPVWSSCLFIVGVLILACIYVERQEF